MASLPTQLDPSTAAYVRALVACRNKMRRSLQISAWQRVLSVGAILATAPWSLAQHRYVSVLFEVAPNIVALLFVTVQSRRFRGRLAALHLELCVLRLWGIADVELNPREAPRAR